MKRDYRGKRPEGKAPLCKCGCKESVNYYRGKWLTFRRFHSKSLHKGQSSYPDNEAPLCECGCGTTVRSYDIKTRQWKKFTKGHYRKGGRWKGKGNFPPSVRLLNAERMCNNNPMHNKETLKKSFQGRKQYFQSKGMSKTEKQILNFFKENKLPIVFTGHYDYWVKNRNPDFLVLNTNKVIEITEKSTYNQGVLKLRDIDSYGIPTVNHYKENQHQCLVIFKKDYKHSLHIDLFKIIKNFIKGKWSGVWNYDHLVKI